MTRIKAHALLDAVSSGMPATRGQITEALCATGDLTKWRANQLEKAEFPLPVVIPSQVAA